MDVDARRPRAGHRRGSARLAVVTGAVLAVGALLVGMDASRRWHRARGGAGPIVPAGALALLVVIPFQDFATSGLESALALCWIATCWWLLLLLSPGASRRYQLWLAVACGLGPLVRPDLALVSAVWLAAAWLIVRPAWRWAAALTGAAAALPVGYEIFRAGYYGLLVPLPALAKSASAADWDRGAEYLVNYVAPYALWIPCVVLLAVLAGALARRRMIGRDLVVLVAPLAAGALAALFVVRVGGDFMHGRMLLPATFLLLLPALTLPLARWSAAVLVLLGGWALWVGLHPQLDHGGRRIDDERLGYVRWTKHGHPIDAEVYAEAEGALVGAVAQDVATHARRFRSEGGIDVAMSSALHAPVVVAVGRLGVGGVVVPLDGIVADTLGLASPLGARITATNPTGNAGHEKVLPWAWLFADFADPAAPPPYDVTAAQIAAARHALTCGDLAELIASTREPMTVGRFFGNLAGSLRRTRLVIPSDPIEAERALCAGSD